MADSVVTNVVTKDKVDDLLGDTLSKAVKTSISSTKTATGVQGTVDKIVTAIANDPVLVNQMNLENPMFSRVVQGAVSVLLTSTWVLYYKGVKVDPALWDLGLLIPTFGAFLGSLWALYGRLKTNLAPVFTSWFGNKVVESK